MGDHWFPPFKGALGVVLFFIISGFLITSLLIREERRDGRVAIGSFYIRRAFRILPLYYVALALATGLVIFGGFGSGRDEYLARLPLLATFNGDFSIHGTFVHAWSIGIEEKFYIFWPLIGFAFLAVRRHRGLVLAILLPICAAAAYVPGADYFGIYTAILAGCTLGYLMHTDRGYAIVSKLAQPWTASAMVCLAVLAFVFDWAMPQAAGSGLAHVPFAIAATLAFPGLVIGNGWLRRALSWPPLVHIGIRSYAIYLFHPFCIDVLNRVVPDNQTEAGPALVRLLLAGLLSLVTAEVLFRVLEKPMIAWGRRISDSRRKAKQPLVPESVFSS